MLPILMALIVFVMVTSGVAMIALLVLGTSDERVDEHSAGSRVVEEFGVAGPELAELGMCVHDEDDSPASIHSQTYSSGTSSLLAHRAAALGIVPPRVEHDILGEDYEGEKSYDALDEDLDDPLDEPSTAMGHLRWDHERQALAEVDDSVVEGRSELLPENDPNNYHDRPSAIEAALSGISTTGLPLHHNWTDELPREASVSMDMELPMDVSMSIDMDLPAELLDGSHDGGGLMARAVGNDTFHDEDFADEDPGEHGVSGPADHILDAEGPLIPGSSILRTPIDPVAMRSDVLFEVFEESGNSSVEDGQANLDDTMNRDPLAPANNLDDLPLDIDELGEACDDEASIWFELDQQHLRGGDLIEKLREKQS